MLTMSARNLPFPDAGIATMKATYLPGTEATPKTPRAITAGVIGQNHLLISRNTSDLSTLVTFGAVHIQGFSKVLKCPSRVCKNRHDTVLPLQEQQSRGPLNVEVVFLPSTV